MFARICGAAALTFVVSLPAHAALTCDDVKAALASALVDVDCFESSDLTTTNESPVHPTTPPDNVPPPGTPPEKANATNFPPFSFTPRTDRSVISPKAGDRTPITKAVPGIQLNARIASDPQGQARFLLRLPADWNGRLVVAGASGTRSEYNGDFAWSDYVVQQGYAYASQNKGVLNLRLAAISPTPPPTDPLACRLNPTSPVWVHFYDNDPGQEFTRWAQFMVQAGQLAQAGVYAAYERPARFTYAVGTSNGGYQVRRAVELAPKVFDGGVDWEGTFVDATPPNLLTDLPPAIRNYPGYAASGFNAASAQAQNIRAAGYPPDIVNGPASFWGNHNAQFWEVTQCQWQKRLDPSYDTYGAGPGNYDYMARLAVSDVGAQLAAFANSGAIQRPLVTVAGTMDALLPINHHARAYARKVAEAAKAQRNNARGADDLRTAYRLYEVQNGNHIETYKDTFSQLEYIEPHAQRAFDLLVDSVERNIPLPASQCIPRGGSISDRPVQAGQCAELLAP